MSALVGMHVIILAGWGAKGGPAGQDFRRFVSDTPAVVTDVVPGSDVWVQPFDSQHKWRVPARALVLA
jgi:hypothetical protein